MNSKKSSFLSVLWLGVLFAVSLFATSCDNFLKAGEVKNDIMEAIEIANSDPVTIYVEAEEGSGTVTPQQLRLKKKESFELRYKAQSSWRFIKWEVRDRNTKEVVPDVINLDDETALETKGRLLVPREGLEIYAKAVIIPEVKSLAPDPGSTNNCYVPIVFTFNTPVDDSDATDTGSVFNYNNILITSDGKDVSYFFEKPYFNSDKTVLTILPKAKDIYDYLNSNHMTVLDLRITLSDRIVVTQGDQEVGLTQNSNTAFVLHYRPVIENTAPVQSGGLILSRKQITKENVEDFSESDKFFKITEAKSPVPSDEQIMRNRIANKVYIYGKFIDDDSSVTAVIVKEVREYDNEIYDGNVYEDTIREPVKYTDKNALFIHDGKITEFFIEHEVMTKPGAVKLDITACDSCGNEASDSLYVFKVGPESYEDLYLYNNKTDDYFDKDYNESIKTLVISDTLTEVVYGDNHTADESKFKMYCLYNNKSMSSETEFEPFSRTYEVTLSNGEVIQRTEEGWKYKLNVATVAGLEFTIVIVDDIGNTLQKTFSFPSEPVVVVSGADTNSQKAYIYSQGFTYEYYIVDPSETRPDRINASFALTTGYPEDSNSYLDSDKEYWVVPYNYDERYGEYRYYLYGAKPSKSFKVNTGNSGTLSDMVSLKSEPQLSVIRNQGKVELSFSLADNSWQTFDSIYYEFFIGSTMYSTTVIEKGSSLVKYNLSSSECNRLYTKDITLKIYGIKDGKKSEPLGKTIVTSKDSNGDSVAEGTYDVTPPSVKIKRKSSSQYRFDISKGYNSNETDLDSLYLIDRKGNAKFLQSLGSDYVFIPVTTLEAEANSDGLWRIKATDKAGNANIFEFAKTIMDSHFSIASLEPSGNKWKMNWYSYAGNSSINSLDYSKIYNGEWKEVYIKERDLTSSYTYFDPKTYGAFDLPAGEFIKLSYIRTRGADELCQYNYAYFYTDTTAKSSGRYDYIQKLSDSEFWVTSDAPALVHTIKTKAPYSECKDWDEYDWEGHQAPLHVVSMPFSDTDHIAQKYLVPLDQIESGECYVVITYFANSENGKLQRLVPHISEVMVKP